MKTLRSDLDDWVKDYERAEAALFDLTKPGFGLMALKPTSSANERDYEMEPRPMVPNGLRDRLQHHSNRWGHGLFYANPEDEQHSNWLNDLYYNMPQEMIDSTMQDWDRFRKTVRFVWPPGEDAYPVAEH